MPGPAIGAGLAGLGAGLHGATKGGGTAAALAVPAAMSAGSAALGTMATALLTPEEKERQQKLGYSSPGVGNVGSTRTAPGQFGGRMSLGSDTPRGSIAMNLLRQRG
jgi:hypothetical protein